MTQSNNNSAASLGHVDVTPEPANTNQEQAKDAQNTGTSEASIGTTSPTEATSIAMRDGIDNDSTNEIAEIAANGPIEIADAKRVLEAALLAANEAMQINELRRLFDGQINGDTLRIMLDELKLEWQGRSVELNLVAGGYRFRVKPQYQRYLDKLSHDKPPKYSRAVMETLAIIAYRQPVTRADIEDVRGVQVSPHILKVLEDRGWVEEIGHKEVVGRPALFATTKHFLDDLNLRTLEELPPLHELQSTLENPHNAVSLMGALELTPMAPTQHYVDEVPRDASVMHFDAGIDTSEPTEDSVIDPPSAAAEPSVPTPQVLATDLAATDLAAAAPESNDASGASAAEDNHAKLDPIDTPAIEEDKKSW